MTPRDRMDAAQELFLARTESRRIPEMSRHLRPETVDDAFEIQCAVTGLLDWEVRGWKCGVPSPNRTVIAPLYVPRLYRSSPCPVIAAGGLTRIEPEVAFVMGRDFGPRETPYAESELREGIARAHLVLELMGSRFSDPNIVSPLEKLADGFNNEGLYIGPEIKDVFARNLTDVQVSIRHGSIAVIERQGRHPDGHPLHPLVWLANFLSARGKTLASGCIVTTGSYIGVAEVPVGVPLTIECQGLGRIEIEFAARGEA